MGGCESDLVIESAQVSSNKKRPKIDFETQANEFPDMKEWKGERYTGIGIKKMRGYKCTLPIDKLNQKREAFWAKRESENFNTWRIIHQACIMDECKLALYFNIK